MNKSSKHSTFFLRSLSSIILLFHTFTFSLFYIHITNLLPCSFQPREVFPLNTVQHRSRPCSLFRPRSRPVDSMSPEHRRMHKRPGYLSSSYGLLSLNNQLGPFR